MGVGGLVFGCVCANLLVTADVVRKAQNDGEEWSALIGQMGVAMVSFDLSFSGV